MKKKSLLNKRIHIVSIVNNIDVWGVVTHIDDKNRLYGTWGDYVVDLKHDHISEN